MSSTTSMNEPSIPGPIPVHVAYSPLASMNPQWPINLHDGYPIPVLWFQGSPSQPLFMFHYEVTTHTLPEIPIMILQV